MTLQSKPIRPFPIQNPNNPGSGIPKRALLGSLGQSHRSQNTRGKAAAPLRSQRLGRQHTAARPGIKMHSVWARMVLENCSLVNSPVLKSAYNHYDKKGENH